MICLHIVLWLQISLWALANRFLENAFFRSRKKIKAISRSTNGQKFGHFLATKFYSHASRKPPNVSTASIFLVSKTLQKMMNMTYFDVLRRQFVNLEQASKRVPKNHAKFSNYAKMQNHHKKRTRKTMDHALAMPKETNDRLTCQNASKYDRFCCSQSCIAWGKCAEIM